MTDLIKQAEALEEKARDREESARMHQANADPEVWAKLTAGLGIATANSYRAAIARATGGGNVQDA